MPIRHSYFQGIMCQMTHEELVQQKLEGREVRVEYMDVSPA